MAISPDASRVGERGLSLIEALVVVTITALLALLLLPMVARSAGRNVDLADRSLSAADAGNAEGEFRLLLRFAMQHGDGAAPRTLEGSADSLLVFPALPRDAACARAGSDTGVRLRIYNEADGGRLACESVSGSLDMLHWKNGRAVLSYSQDGERWVRNWADIAPTSQAARGGATPATRNAPLVRFELSQPDGRALVWIVRAGSTEATRIDRQSPPKEGREP